MNNKTELVRVYLPTSIFDHHRYSGRITSVIVAESVAATKKQKQNYVTNIQQCCQPQIIK